MTCESVENLAIGGGLAGSMVAMRLAAAGREVVLVEKEREAHHKVCGEFLSAEAIHYLRQAGIEPLDLGAQSIQRVRFLSGARNVEARLPFTALSLSRRILDESLLVKAQQAGCAVRRAACVERLEAAGNGWSVRLRGGEAIQAKTVFLATGKHDLNAWERGGASQPDLVGFKMHWRLAPAQSEILRGVMELFLFRGGYGGLAMVEAGTVEGGIANLCLVVRRNTLRLLGGWEQLLHSMQNQLPALHDLLTDATPCWQKPLAISPIPYGHLGGPANGVWRVGDQAAVIPSFTGDGMSIALHTGILAAEMYLAGKGPDEYLLSVTVQLRAAMQFASRLSRAMVTPAARAIAPVLLSLVPSAIARIALSTRIPEPALLTTRVGPVAPIPRQSAPIA
ncbi:MAG: FAD-dependent monooxygenase [Terracidiphilus sp.]